MAKRNLQKISNNSFPEFLLYTTPNGKVKVEFAAPQKSVTPGQSAVFYRGDVVLGGAVIDAPIPCPEEIGVYGN